MKLFYYTTTETMRYIVTGGNIFATNVGYMNDSDEYFNGLRELKLLLEEAGKFADSQSLKEIKDIDDIYQNILAHASGIYSISFSKASDLLSQWHMYAKESGVQIELNFQDNKQYMYYDGRSVADEEKDQWNKPLSKDDVYYLTKGQMLPEEYKETGKQVLIKLDSLLNSNGKDSGDEIQRTWRGLAPYIKNYGFRQEQEVRAIFQKDEDSYINYRNDRGVLKPYLDIHLKEGWPICGIMVGPGRNQNQVYKGICHFLENTELVIDKQRDEMLIDEYFNGMKGCMLPEQKVNQCKEEVLALDEKTRGMGVTYSQQIKDVLDNANFSDAERMVVDQYENDNYFCDKGIIVKKSKLPYEF